MNYRSTRGGVAGVGFTDSLLMGLGADGGLLVPESIPDVSADLDAWRELDFVALAKEVIALFVGDISVPPSVYDAFGLSMPGELFAESGVVRLSPS